MKIKRYKAASMRTALGQVRAEQGPDAVILSSRRLSDGIEVIAAVDYDEELLAGARQHLLALRAAAGGAESPPMRAPERAPTPAAVAPRKEVARAASPPQHAQVSLATAPASPPAAKARASLATAPAPPPAKAPASTAMAPASTAMAPAPPPARAPASTAMAPAPPPPKAPASAPAAASRKSGDAAHSAPRAASPGEARPGFATVHHFAAVHRELKDLRSLLESGLARISGQDKRLREPLRARVLEDLSAMNIAPDVAASLAARTPPLTGLADPSNVPLALLIRHLPVVERLSAANCGLFAVVGPAGAGKTTTIAKLAARWIRQHGTNDVALVSTDTQRAGAREQLATYARALGAPMHTPGNGTELARLLEGLRSKRLVLIDTPGMGPRDTHLVEQLATLKLGAARGRVLLALPAHAEEKSLEEIIRAFSRVSPAACILTKLDEAASLGAVLSATLRHRLKIAYLCNGQRVPEDLHLAHQRRLWLVLAAHNLKEQPRHRGDALARLDRGHAHV